MLTEALTIHIRRLASLVAAFLLTASSIAVALPPESNHARIQVVPTPGEVTINGVLGDEEWDKTGRMYVYPVKKIRDRYAVRVYAMWDKDAFYLGMKYRDPTPMINNVDGVNAPYDGWQSDGFQGRFVTDYGQIHFTAWYSSMKDYTVATLSYNRPLNRDNSRVFSRAGKRIDDPSGFKMAFKRDTDNRGYVQEVRIPWKQLYRNVPAIEGGHEFQFTGEYFWGGPTGIKWPAVMWADPMNPAQPVRVNVYKNPHTWGKAKLLAEGNLDIEPIEDTGDLMLQGPIPIRVAIPIEATRFSLAIDDGNGERVRNLASHGEVKDYEVAVDEEAGTRTIEVPWDGRADGHWDKELYLFRGEVVEPGSYTVRVLTHQGVGVVHEGSFYNPGTPPWPTADGTGGWLSDHYPPNEVATLTPGSEGEIRTFLHSHSGETGVSLIGLDATGQRQWFWTRNAAGIHHIAGAPDALVFTFAYVGKQILGKIDPKTGRQIDFTADRPEMKLDARPTALAANAEHIAIAMPDHIALRRLTDGHPEGRLDLAGATGLNFAPDGGLVGIVDGQLFVADLDSKQVQRFELEGVTEPRAVTVDDDGRLYVSDAATQTIVEFASVAPDAKPVRAIGEPGGHGVGEFNPMQMNAPRSLAIDERPDGTKHLWAVEGSQRIRRIVVWNVAAKTPTLVHDFVGNTGYMGHGGTISDDIPTLGMYNGVIYDIDYANYDYRPLEVIGTPEVEDKTQVFSPVPGPAFTNGYHFISDVSGQPREYYIVRNGGGFSPATNVIWMRDGEPQGDGAWRCVAAIGPAHGYHPPKGFPRPERNSNFILWNDLNHDGYQSPDEIQLITPPTPRFMHNTMWGYRCDDDLVWHHSGYAVQPVRFTDRGAPVYSPDSFEKLPGALGDLAATKEGMPIFKTRFGYVAHERNRTLGPDPHATVHGLFELVGYDNDGHRRWTYPAYWHSVHGAMTAPQALPGVIMGMLKFTGIIELSDEHSLIGVRGNTGQDFLIRDDGMYVGELFIDQRMAPESLPTEEKIRGVPINDTSLGGECFSGVMAAQRDGAVRLTYGHTDVRIAKVTGLDAVGPGITQSLQLSAEQVAEAERFTPTTGGRKTTQYAISRGDSFRKGPVDFDANAIPIAFGRSEQVGSAKLAYDEANLYATWRIDDLTPWRNAGRDPKTAFKSGDAVELLIAEKDAAKPDQLGGTRVIISPIKGGTAVVYRPTGPGNEPFTFESPVRKTTFQYVAVEPAIEVHGGAGQRVYRVSATIPWKTLGITPEPGRELRGDVGVIFGRSDATTHIDRIVRWVDDQTNVTNDLPTEAEFFPERWGDFVLE